MVICMTTSFPHMLTDKDAVAALNSMYDRLNDQGILVINNGITDALLNGKPKCILGRISGNQAFYFFLEYPHSKRVIVNVLQVKKTKDSFEHAFFVVPYNAMRKSALEKYLAKTKFKKVQYFGDDRSRKYSEKDSGRLIVVAQK